MNGFISRAASCVRNAVYYDDESALKLKWGDYLKCGNVFFFVRGSRSIEVYWRSINCNLIDQFSHMRLAVDGDLQETINDGRFQIFGKTFTKKDAPNALDEICKEYPYLLKISTFERGQKNTFFFNKADEERWRGSFLFNVDEYSEREEKNIEYKIIKKISLIGLNADDITPLIPKFDGVFSPEIEPDCDLIIFSK